MHEERAILAANNNADLYEAMFSAWKLRCTRLPFAFIGEDLPPPYYSNLTVTSPGHTGQVLAELRRAASRLGSSLGFKDSFCEFGVGENGFNLLFGASWIWRSPSRALPSEWVRVDNAEDLQEWETAWKHYGSPTPRRMFRNELLSCSDVALLFRKDDGEIVSGCIANRSSQCVGLSNLFSAIGDKAHFEQAAAAAGSTFPGLPIVGYANGERLQAAYAAGFERTGDLRILLALHSAYCLQGPIPPK